MLTSDEDQDLAEMEGATKEQIRTNLDLTVHVFARRANELVELERTVMLGGAQPLKVVRLKGGGSRNFIVATALHCGASCAGLELHVVGMRNGKLERLLTRESVDHGDVTITPDSELEVREVVYSSDDGSEPVATKVTRYVVGNGELVVAAARTDRMD